MMMKTICDIKTSWKLTVLVEEHQNCFYRFPESVCLKCIALSGSLSVTPLDGYDKVVLRFRTSVLGVDEAENTPKGQELWE